MLLQNWQVVLDPIHEETHMQRLFAGLWIIPALALFTGLSGCGKEEPVKPSNRPKIGGGGSSGGAEAKKSTIKPGTATVTGKVVYSGDLPVIASLTKVMDEHADKKTCHEGTEAEKVDQTWTIGKDRGVANAVIWLSPPGDSEFEVKDEKSDAVLDQPHCVYIPHVVVVKPGQKLLVKNSAPIIHNTKLDVDNFVNKSFGQAIPPKDSVSVDLKPQDNPITATCEFHAWMKAKIWVLPHQYVAVTKADGSFSIPNVPEGVELSVVAWHEGAGFFNGGKKGKAQKFSAGENKLPDLSVTAK